MLKLKAPPAKVIGATQSGAPIYNRASHPAHKNFAYMDHFAAQYAHRDAMKEIDKQRDREGYLYDQSIQDLYTWHWLQYDAHQRKGKRIMKQIFN